MKTYLRILRYGLKNLSDGILATVFLFLYNFFGVFSIALVLPFLRILFNMAGDSPEPSGNLDILAHGYQVLADFVNDYGRWEALQLVCILLVVSITLKSLFRYLGSYFVAPFEQGVIFELRKTLFDQLKRLSLEFFTGKKKGKIINTLVTDVQIVQESVIGTVNSIISAPFSLFIILIFLINISWELTLFTLLILPATGLFINYISKTLKKRARRGQERLGELISVLDEFISGIRIVKAFGTEKYEYDKYMAENDAYRKEMVGLRRRSDLASPITEVFSVMVIAGIMLFGGYLILHGDTRLGPDAFITFIALFGQFIAPVKVLSGAISKIQKGIASFNRIEEFLAYPEVVRQKPGAKPVKDFEENIEFENVQFNYGSEPVLKDINLKINRGEMVALVGPSGAGKSTLADLLPRFYDPVAGRILLDGTDIRELDVFGLRGMFGVVSQEGVLFNESVLRNIAYGDVKPDQERVIEAAKVANAHEFISEFPDGYYTMMGERGTRLSGGQRQRIAIARAVYRNPSILILDEATSALDSESEKLVQRALDELMKGRTAIVIAHRLSTIMNADKIVVLDAGKIVETGQHEELIAKDGLYSRLYSYQFE